MGLSWFLVGVGRKDVGPQDFLAASSLKHILSFFFFFTCFPVNFECLKESLFLCRLPIQGGDLVLSISFWAGSWLTVSLEISSFPFQKGKRGVWWGGNSLLSVLYLHLCTLAFLAEGAR